MSPALLLLLGYGSYVVLGWGLLSLPFAQRQHVGALDNLFIATSAMSTTGLATVSVSDSYTIFGQLVVLGLIQLGGIGYMTLGSFIVLSRRLDMSQFRAEIGRAVFSLPTSFRIDKFVRSVVRFTVVIEIAGALALWPVLADAGVEHPLWSAVFHSISAFCTAGFSLHNSSFEAFAGNFWANVFLGVLSYAGAVGFIVFVDLWRKITKKTQQITLTSRIILWTTAMLGVAATLLLFVAEPTIQTLPADERLLAAFFQSMTASTTVGFNTINIGALSKGSLLLLVILMVIGASPSGTGGGLKSTTISAIAGVMGSALRGQTEIRFWGNPIPVERVWTAVASAGFYLSVLVGTTYLLELTETTPTFDENLFEAASALGTVGLSMGITASLSPLGKLLITFLMFCGRVGPLTFGTALVRSESPASADQDLAV
jgi:trk system potassium uptake protein TrkH